MKIMGGSKFEYSFAPPPLSKKWILELVHRAGEPKAQKNILIHGSSSSFPTQEQSYKSPMAPNDAIALLDNTELEILDSPKVTKEVIGERPNTYTFTKAIAEELVMTECQGSILVLIWRELWIITILFSF